MEARPIFLGYRVKQPWVPDAAWFLPDETGVAVVCSVSDHLALPPAGWIDRWDFNRATCYDTEAAALATRPPSGQRQYACFVYQLVPFVLDSSGHNDPVNPDDLFDARLPPLPAPRTTWPDYVRLGYDAVSTPGASEATMGFECSPLSCNGMAKEIAVNRYCLIDELGQALDVARRFDAEQPEPGKYVVVEVSVRSADLDWLANRA